MKNIEFLDIVGNIDDEFIRKSEKTATCFRMKYLISAATCLVLILGAYLSFPQLKSIFPKSTETVMNEKNETAEMQNTGEKTQAMPEYPETENEQPVTETSPEDTEPAPDIIQENPSANSPVNTELLNGKPMISGYGNNSEISDTAVDNGNALFSGSLTSAMAEYGDTANYRVLVNLFQNGIQILNTSEIASQESQRLVANGYTVAMETVKHEENFGEYESVYFTLHATFDQLTNIQPSGDIGYYVMLYEEYFGKPENYEAQNFNGGVQ